VDAPNGVADIICHQQSAMTIQGDPNRPATCLSIGIEESS
jgi:hypothetical protein